MAEIPQPCLVKYACGHWATTPASAEADEEGGLTELTAEELEQRGRQREQDPESCVKLELRLNKCPECLKRPRRDPRWNWYFWDRSWW